MESGTERLKPCSQQVKSGGTHEKSHDVSYYANHIPIYPSITHDLKVNSALGHIHTMRLVRLHKKRIGKTMIVKSYVNKAFYNE